MQNLPLSSTDKDDRIFRVDTAGNSGRNDAFQKHKKEDDIGSLLGFYRAHAAKIIQLVARGKFT